MESQNGLESEKSINNAVNKIGLNYEILNVDSTSEERDLSFKAKTSLRMHYEAQVNVIKGQIGELEEVRLKLGLSGRKMAQLLMVDPSAWTRWTKSGDEAPPHVWRALQWYLTIQQQIPGLTPQYFIARDQGAVNLEAIRKIDQIKEEIEIRDRSLGALSDRNIELEAKIIDLQHAVRANKVTAVILGLAALIMSLAFYKMLKG